MKSFFVKNRLKKKHDYLAPDGSEIRLLAGLNSGGLCHCTLPPGKTSAAVMHKTVNEIWYILSGEGELWQSPNAKNTGKTVKVSSGDCLTIPVRNRFQFRNTGSKDLCILIATIPAWPGSSEAIPSKGRWPAP